jgi:hypothetical protein
MHPVHVSVTNFEYNTKDKAAKLSVKVFPDDFELAFMHNYNLSLNLGTDSIHPEWKKYMDMYFSKMFLLKVNNKTNIPLVFMNYEMKDDGILLYFTAPMSGKIKSLQIDNGILLDIFENQTNLLILSINGKEKGYNLNFNNYKVDLKL